MGIDGAGGEGSVTGLLEMMRLRPRSLPRTNSVIVGLCGLWDSLKGHSLGIMTGTSMGLDDGNKGREEVKATFPLNLVLKWTFEVNFFSWKEWKYIFPKHQVWKKSFIYFPVWFKSTLLYPLSLTHPWAISLIQALLWSRAAGVSLAVHGRLLSSTVSFVLGLCEKKGTVLFAEAENWVNSRVCAIL